MDYVIGIDGGGSKSKGVLLGIDGNLYAASQCESTNYQTVGREQASSLLGELIKDLLSKSAVDPGRVINVVGCLAGIDSKKDKKIMEHALRIVIKDAIPDMSSKIQMYNDGLAALYSVDGSGFGAIIVAGTGSIAFGKDANGNIHQVGGWGHVIGDLGSGYDVGRKAIISVVAESEGIAPSTQLTPYILKHLDLGDARELISWVNSTDRSPSDIAELVPIVTNCAEKKDPVAHQILVDTAEALGTLACHLLEKGKWEQKKLSLVGGLANLFEWFRDPMIEIVKGRHPDAQWVKPSYPPEMGAAFVALEKVGCKLEAYDWRSFL